MSFVIRLVIDEADTSAWRGHITHVQSNERQQVRSVRQLNAFITHRLRQAGFRPPGLLEQLGQWLHRHDR